MQKLLFDFFPLLLFFIAYKLYDIFVATLVVMAAMLVQMGYFWFRKQKIEPIYWVSFLVILIFGGMTVILKDDVFIKWKPTIINGIFALIVLGSHWIGDKTVIERLLGKQMVLAKSIWNRINCSWGLFFLISGLLNIYVAFYYRIDLDAQVRTDFWVNFKVFGLLAMTVVFIIGQAIYLSRHLSTDSQARTEDKTDT